jgi:twitching motility protein PilT
MTGYSLPDLLKLLQTERGDRMLLDVGAPPTLILNGELHAVEGPPLFEESAEEMIRSVASTREMRTFRRSGSVDIIVPFGGSRFLVRAIRAFGEFRLELQPITV